MQRKLYKNPPIDEALCEFRFVAKTPWNLTVPGRMFDLLKEYDGPPQNVVQDQVAMPNAPVGPPVFAFNRSLSVRLSNAAGTQMVTIGPDLLVVHALRPYPEAGWGAFRPRVEAALNAYVSVASPEVVHRVGVRYVNRLDLTSAEPNLSDVFTAPPPDVPVPGLNGQVPVGFLQRAEYSYDAQTRLVVTLARVDGAPERMTFVLDLDVIWENIGQPCSVTDTMSMTDDLHSREHEAFESLLTPDFKRHFNE